MPTAASASAAAPRLCSRPCEPWATAAAVARDMLEGTVQVQPKDIQEVKLRNTIADDVVAGNITEAIHLADTLAPGMLSANPSLQFRLHLQTFFDLVRSFSESFSQSCGKSAFSVCR